jgi:WD40 repeat protein
MRLSTVSTSPPSMAFLLFFGKPFPYIFFYILVIELSFISYCIAFPFLFCLTSGGNRWICCWKWEDLLAHNGPDAPEPLQVYNCAQNFHQPLQAQHLVAADVNSLASDSQGSSLYAGCGDSILYHLDCQTGQTVNCFVGHNSFIHKVKTFGESSNSRSNLLSCDDTGNVLLWDQRSSRDYTRCNIQEQICDMKSTIFRGKRLWCGGIDVDQSGNFLYVGGGVESSAGAGGGGSPPSLGWAAVCHIGSGASDSGMRALCATSLASPVQELLLQEDYVVCGGAQASIRYLSSTSLGSCR